MASLTHPFDPDTLYELADDGNIRVSKGDKVGLFTTQGVFISGDIRQADPQVCVWVGNNPDPQQPASKSSIMVKRRAPQ